jgi:hypothetical protein
MSKFIVADRQTDYLLPPSVDDWLNQDHLARFIVEVIDQLDLSKLTREYAGRGSKAYHPAGHPPGDSGLWLRHGYLLQPQAGAGNLRLDSLPLHRRQPSSRSRQLGHFPPTVP